MKNCISLLILCWMLFACAEKRQEQTADVSTESVKNDLPVLQIDLLSGKTIQGTELKGPTVLILFQPDCDHCQHEAEDIGKHLEDFKSYTLYFVSSASVEEIAKFATDYKLADKPNILFGKTTIEGVLSNFGSIQAPSIYIYSEEGKLKKQFNGQTDVGVMVGYL